ncbi:MAG: RraA family protein [Rhodospirillales bacterium]
MSDEPLSDAPLSQDELAALGALDTPTVCNALEVLAPERRGYGYTTESLTCAWPKLPPIVGYARTATLRSMRPAASGAAEQRTMRLNYYEYVHDGPRPAIVVIQDLDPAPGYGAFWGEVQSHLHKALGASGAITNGSIRDLDACAEGFQLLAGKVAASHAFANLAAIDIEVTVAGMAVRPGDLIHADRHGAVVIPHALARELPAAADLVTRREAVVLEACRREDFGIETLRTALGRADEIH